MTGLFPCRLLLWELPPGCRASPRRVLERLPAGKAQAVAALRRREDALCAAAAYALLERALGRLEDPPSLADLHWDALGRPFFPARPDLFVSLSHSRRGAACALAPCPVGVDTEETDQPLEDWRELAREAGFSGVSSREGFLALWTMWESFFKQAGGRCARPRPLRARPWGEGFRLEGEGLPPALFLLSPSPARLTALCLPPGASRPLFETIKEELFCL